jgi:peptidoglycan/LPS O-acetylase OafA/YrhL
MSRSLSLYLDLLRFGSCLAVFIGHLLFNVKWSGIRGGNLSIVNDAVVCFFVLSGLASCRIAGGRRRADRIAYSPALTGLPSHRLVLATSGLVLAWLCRQTGVATPAGLR